MNSALFSTGSFNNVYKEITGYARWVFDQQINIKQAQIPWIIGAFLLFVCVLIFIIFLLERARRMGKAADAAKRTKTVFLANKSHEIKFDTIDEPDSYVYKDKTEHKELKIPTFIGEVLLCEDNHMNQKVINEHLERVGLKVVVAENGKAGVDLVNERQYNENDTNAVSNISSGDNSTICSDLKKQFDLIFMDIHMPVMDGLEAAERIKKIDDTIPIIALTANIMTHDREMYMTKGINDYVENPFSSQELWHCLLRYLYPVAWQE